MSGQDKPTENNNNWEESLIDLLQDGEESNELEFLDPNDPDNSWGENISLEEDLESFLEENDAPIGENVDIPQQELSKISLEDDTQDLLPFIQNNDSHNLASSELAELEVADVDQIELESPGTNEEDDSLGELISLEDLVDFNLIDNDNFEEIVEDSLEGKEEIEVLAPDFPSFSHDLAELDDILDEPTPVNSLGELEGLLDSTPEEIQIEPKLSSASLDNSELNLANLEQFLDSSEETPLTSSPIPASQTKINQPSQPNPRAQTAKVFDQTMRVSVKKLDNLNNLIGELVVKRNRLEEDQERLRRFLDNLNGHVQSLGDMGGKMHDLYERSLLEGALLSSRQNNSASTRRHSGFLNVQQQEEDDGLGALEMDRFTGFHLLSQDIIELIVRVREAASDIQFVVDETDKITQSLRQVTSQLQEGINSSRMINFGQTADRLPRAVRDISRKLHKKAELQVEGRDVLIDKMIVEHLYNPMTHLVNNAIAHGIETPEERLKKGKIEVGRITIRAFIQGNQTVITVSDDGAGIDPEKVKAKAVEKNLLTWADAQHLSEQDVYDLLFHPGFSTKDRADDFAGRGVGMDVVSTDLKKIRGAISIESAIDKGTTFTIRLPLVLSICKALTCVYNKTRIAFSIDGVEDTKELTPSDVQTNANGVKCIAWRDNLLPFQPLSNLLSYNRRIRSGSVYGNEQDDDTISIVILRGADHFLAIEVDRVIGEQEIVIKQIEGPVPKPAGIAGATVLGDGSIMPIGDVLELIEISQGKRTTEIGFKIWQTGLNLGQEQAEKERTEPLVLVVDDSITVRELLSLSFNKLGYRVEQARDGQEAWNKIRGGLPCDMIFCDIEMPRMNGLELLSHLQQDEELAKIPVAMLTSRGAEKHRQLATDFGAKAYLTKPYTEKDLMDVAQSLIKFNQSSKKAEKEKLIPSKEIEQQNSSTETVKKAPTVLIIDDSITVRELLSMTFRKAGYQVEQARDGQEAWEKLQAGLECDIAFCDIEMPRMNGLELLSHLQEHEVLSSLPVAMLTSRGAQKMRNIAAKRGAIGYFVKPYVEDILLEAAQKMMSGEVLLEKINLDNLDSTEE